MEDITKIEIKQKFSFNNRMYSASDDIAFFSQELYILKLENQLIGDYDSGGKYVLPQEIFKNLTDLKKVITKKEEETLFLKAEALNREFKFIIKLSTHNKTQKVAQLFLVETLTSVMFEGKEIVSLVASYIDENDAFFIEKFKKVFNIVLDDEDGKKEENEIIVKALLEKLKFENKVYVNFLLQTRLKDKIYVEKLLKSLSEDKTGHAILKKYEILLAKYGAKLNPSDKDYYRKLKQILDEILEEEKKVLSDNLNLLLIRLRQAYVKSNAPIIETLKTAVIEKKKEIEKAIKTGKGAGALKFSYYKGVSLKKPAKKPAKKRLNIEERHNRREKSSQEIARPDEDIFKKVTSAYLAGRLGGKNKFDVMTQQAEINTKIENQTSTYKHQTESVKISKQSYEKQNLEKKEISKQASVAKPKPKVEEKKKEETSLFGMLFGGD